MSQLYRISGHLPAAGSTVEFLDATAFVSYPSVREWVADVVLEPERVSYPYRYITDGVPGSWMSLTVQTGGEELEERAAFNQLDEIGVMLATPRLSGERNLAYRNRLADVFVREAGPTGEGLHNALCRNLALELYDQALVLSVRDNPATGLPLPDVAVRLGYRYVDVECDHLRMEEEVVIDPRELSALLSERVVADLVVEEERGRTVPTHSYWLHEDTNTLYMRDAAYAGRALTVRYRYLERVDREGLTLAQLETALESLQTPRGTQLLDVTVQSGLEAYAASHLIPHERVRLREVHRDATNEEVSGLPLRWSAVRLSSVFDIEFHSLLRNDQGTLWNTRLSSYAESLRALARGTWGRAVADESVLGDASFPVEGGLVVESVFDAPLGFWRDGSGGQRDQWQIRSGLSGDYRGVLREHLRSGVGGELDLMVVVGGSTRGLSLESEGSHYVAQSDEETTVPSGSTPQTGGVILS